MLLTASLLFLAPVECFPPDTVTGQRQIRIGECPDPDKPPPPPDRAPTASEQNRAKAAFDLVAFDGPSARWRFEVTRKGYLVCGYVNAKNRLGAYVGWTPFTYDLDDDTFATHGDQQWLYDLVCHDKPPD